MRRFLFGLLLGLLIGAGGYWYYAEGQNRNLKQDMSHSTQTVEEKARKAGEVVEEKAKKAGAVIADATANARVTAAVKARLTKDLGLAALAEISVDTTDGLVTLSGSVPSTEDIDKAVKIAADTDGVQKVISTLQVKPPK